MKTSLSRLDFATRGTWRRESSNARNADPAEGRDLLLRGLPGARSLGARTVHQPLLRRGEKIAAEEIETHDELGAYIAKIEKSDKAFQRGLSKTKVGQIRNFYETAVSQPPIPATVLCSRTKSSGSRRLGASTTWGTSSSRTTST
jgi:hypothetical protein